MQQHLFKQQEVGSAAEAGDRRSTALAAAIKQLNPAQREAVCAAPGAILVIAGAGSGKTRTLVHRLAWLVDQGIPPEELLLLTFTRKAAQEMIGRAGLLLNDSCYRVTGGTFHATANLLLRRYARRIGYEANFTILDQGDAEGIINLLKSSLGLGGGGRRFPSRRLILGILSKAVNVGVTVSDLVEAEHDHLAEYLDDILAIGDHYQRFKQDHGLMDYDDLLVNWRRLLREDEQVRGELVQRFKAILVDEYQDTNPIQAEIVRLLAAPRNHVMAVGDDAQSIYSFRGADFRNIMEFPEHFPGTKVIRLEENYRSTQEILEVGNAIIAPAPVRYPKQLFSRRQGGQRPVLHAARNEGGQARFVVERIKALHREGVDYREMAVLFRSGFHSYQLELELAAQGIDFEKRGGLKLTESAHIKDLLAHFRVLCNPADRLSWNRVLLLIDRIGPKTASNIIDRLLPVATAPPPAKNGMPEPATSNGAVGAGGPAAAAPADSAVPAALAAPAGPGAAAEDSPERREPPGGEVFKQVLAVLAAYPAGKTWQAGMKRLLELLADLRAAARNPLELLELALIYYQPLLKHLYPDDYPRRQRDLEQLRSLLAPYEDIRDFLADLALDPPADDPAAAQREEGRLILSTVHSAKGLEWDTVFVIHLAEGKFPAGQASGPEQFEEERRLLYVAATRAKSRLFLVYPRETLGHDRRPVLCPPSPFLEPLPPNLLGAGGEGELSQPGLADDGSAVGLAYQEALKQRVGGGPGGSLPGGRGGAGVPGGQNSREAATADAEQLAVGSRVLHPFFGPGVLVKKVAERTVEVNFDRHGRKTLHLDYARLTPYAT